MQGIYPYIPETNHVPREHFVAAILVLIFMVLISLVPQLTTWYYYYYYYYVSCHRPILPGNSLEPTVIPTAQASSFTLQYFPYYV